MDFITFWVWTSLVAKSLDVFLANQLRKRGEGFPCCHTFCLGNRKEAFAPVAKGCVQGYAGVSIFFRRFGPVQPVKLLLDPSLRALAGPGWFGSPARLRDAFSPLSFAQCRPFNLLVFWFWSIFSGGPKRLTFFFQVLSATELLGFLRGVHF